MTERVRYAGATYTDDELRQAIARARAYKQGRYSGGWGVVGPEGLICVWPTEDAANEQRDEVNAISEKFSLSVWYHVERIGS